jgi:NAD(P)-dependent dehydrogenase (short-subunit alcohol dehydrogenase family)
VNVSNGIAARPASMLRGNAYAATKGALEAHAVNLAAELAGIGVTVNAYRRPGGVDTAMQDWIRGQDPERIGTLHERFNRHFADGALITPWAIRRRAARPPVRRRHRPDLGRQRRLRRGLTAAPRRAEIPPGTPPAYLAGRDHGFRDHGRRARCRGYLTAMTSRG